MIVAFFTPHSEGFIAGLITGPGFDSGTELVDLFEVDQSVRSFDTVVEAEEWLEEQVTQVSDDGDQELDLQDVAGGQLQIALYS